MRVHTFISLFILMQLRCRYAPLSGSLLALCALAYLLAYLVVNIWSCIISGCEYWMTFLEKNALWCAMIGKALTGNGRTIWIACMFLELRERKDPVSNRQVLCSVYIVVQAPLQPILFSHNDRRGSYKHTASLGYLLQLHYKQVLKNCSSMRLTSSKFKEFSTFLLERFSHPLSTNIPCC